MSTTKPRMMYTPALELAQNIVINLRPACQRIEIAGSLRRKKPDVGDIEIVLIPKHVEGLPLLAAAAYPETLFAESIDTILTRLSANRGWKVIKNGQWMKQFDIGLTVLELYITTPEKWGCIFTIRTGPAEFSHNLVTHKNKGGLCPSYLHFADGRIWDGNRPMVTPEEADVFRAIGLPWIEPESRK